MPKRGTSPSSGATLSDGLSSWAETPLVGIMASRSANKKRKFKCFKANFNVIKVHKNPENARLTSFDYNV
jgi:hypothetical protein